MTLMQLGPASCWPIRLGSRIRLDYLAGQRRACTLEKLPASASEIERHGIITTSHHSYVFLVTILPFLF
jgi:hypothetical protein